MRKTIGLLALTVGLSAAGCAMLPHGVQAPSITGAGMTAQGMSAPGVIRFSNPAYGVQTIGTVTTAAKQVEILVYDQYGNVATNSAGVPVTATASITGTTATASVPGMPAGWHEIQVNIYKTTGKHHEADGSTSATDSSAIDTDLIYQTEATVSAIVGAPVNATMTLWPVASYNKVVDASQSTTTQFELDKIVGPFYYRFARWNPALRMPSPTGKVRLSLVSTTNFATGSLNTATPSFYWFLASSTGSEQISTASNAATWSWTPDYKTIYTDIDFKGVLGSTYGKMYADTTSASGSAFSFYIPTGVMLPSGVNLFITDLSSGSSNVTGL